MRIVKNILITALAILFLPKIAFAQPEPPLGTKWATVTALSDEFDRWDSNKWSYSLWNYTPPNIMMASQVKVANGTLQIRAELHDDETRWMKTCRIMSKAQISYPMYTECSMKASDISSYNTFWLNNGNSENRNEIDVCENNANPSNPATKHGIEEFPYIMQSNIHHAVDGVNLQSPNYYSTKALSDGNPNKGKNFNESYHTLGLYWEDNRKCHWYLDGEFVGTSVAQRNFTRKLNVLFDMWCNTWDGFPNKEDLKDPSRNTMYVDWIHTYKLVPGNDQIQINTPPSFYQADTALTVNIDYYTNAKRTITVRIKGDVDYGSTTLESEVGTHNTIAISVPIQAIGESDSISLTASLHDLSGNELDADSAKTFLINGSYPYLGKAFSVPTEIEAEYFDLGGEGYAYRDKDTRNKGGYLRLDEGVDIQKRLSKAVITWTQDGEWLNYTIQIDSAGTYKLVLLTSASKTTGRAHIILDTDTLLKAIEIPRTMNLNTFKAHSYRIDLPSGAHQLKFEVATGGFFLDKFSILNDKGEVNALVENELNPILIYPNPAKNEVTIELGNYSEARITLHNVLGEAVKYVNAVNSERIILNVSQLKKGVYFVVIKFPSRTISQKIMVG